MLLKGQLLPLKSEGKKSCRCSDNVHYPIDGLTFERYREASPVTYFYHKEKWVSKYIQY